MKLSQGLSGEQFGLAKLMAKQRTKKAFGLGCDFNIKKCRRERIESVIVSRERMDHPSTDRLPIARCLGNRANHLARPDLEKPVGLVSIERRREIRRNANLPQESALELTQNRLD